MTNFQTILILIPAIAYVFQLSWWIGYLISDSFDDKKEALLGLIPVFPLAHLIYIKFKQL